jgi:hypothetical protein
VERVLLLDDLLLQRVSLLSGTGGGVPSKLARERGSSRLGLRSVVAVVIVGLRPVCCEGDLSSGPFFTSLVASCSKRDLRELTDERVESSTDSVLSIVAGSKRTFLFHTLTPSSMVADKRHEFRRDRNHDFDFLKRNR